MIYVINTKCSRCGRIIQVQGMHEDGDLYIDMMPELTVTAMCKNITVCQEKTHREHNSCPCGDPRCHWPNDNQKAREQEPAVLYQDGVPAYLWPTS